MRWRRPRLYNPFLFTPWPVTIIATIFYVALVAALLAVHIVVPSAPKSSTPVRGINISEAWTDLQELTFEFRPYISRRNDEVRDWLLGRIETIMANNGVAYASETMDESAVPIHRTVQRRYGGAESAVNVEKVEANGWSSPKRSQREQFTPDPAVIFNDLVSNVTYSGDLLSSSGNESEPIQSVYFEGTNIVVYIRGSEDDIKEPWNRSEDSSAHKKPKGKGGVLVNAHYDSVSTGFGATDDGVGVITILQLIKYFTTPGNTPRRGLVALLNNGEEDYLNGAIAFSQHPISRFARTFLNLEGAGAGGRATLFRSTDTEITRFYGKSPHPYGTVISSDGFERGLIRSQTDYVVFNGLLGLRGLDVAFMEPRARYHTNQDDSKHTSIDSLWHMLSAALATTQGLTSDTSSRFDTLKKKTKDDESDEPNSGGPQGVWFDLFGRVFAVLRLRTLFAISLTLLVVTPLILAVIVYILHRKEKMYFFASTVSHEKSTIGEPIRLQGWRGFSRFLLTIIVASVAVMALAYLVTKVNPFIVYSSQYSVWSMMLSAWVVVTWFILSVADFVRPSALHRGYALMWMYVLGWIVLIAVTVFEDRLDVAGGYFMVIYFGATFLSFLIALLELFALTRKTDYASTQMDQDRDSRQGRTSRSGSLPSSTLIAPSADEVPPSTGDNPDENEEEATESTPLFRGRGQTFANYSRSQQRSGEGPEGGEGGVDPQENPEKGHAYGEEQEWSAALPTWTWLFQIIFMVPINVIVVGQVALLFTSAMYQTGADGSPSLLIYMAIAIFTILILTPVGPFIHRFTYHVPTFLFFVFVGTLIYNLVAFPFSANNRLKVFFVQSVDLESGLNEVSLTGIEEHVRRVIDFMPSAAGQKIECSHVKAGKLGLQRCGWRGLAPNVVRTIPPNIPPERGFPDWIHFNVTRLERANEAKFHLYGRNTRACKLIFHAPISHFHVKGAARDPRFQPVSDAGSKEIRLWSREWEKPWDVHVKWPVDEGKQPGDGGLDGKVVCLWSDDNQPDAIPALGELRRYAPDWVGFTKMSDGLVEGHKSFMI
ncbi:MAG: hypothetical protein M1837_006448 [Sclerophora amabilis]|nr:MAG: hypothetical protein M1837_006448 [Sclerophora amabilis]